MTKVLLIDDDIELTNLLSEYLTEEGFSVETTTDGRVGIAESMSSSIDLIVLDIMMPRMNGIDVLRENQAGQRGARADADGPRR